MKREIKLFNIILIFIGFMYLLATESFGNISFIPNDSTEITGPIQVKEFPLELVYPSAGISFYKDGLLYLSEVKNHNRITSNHISFGISETYYALLEDSIIASPRIFSESSKFSSPCEAMSFNSDYSELYFPMISIKDGKEKIYKADFLEVDGVTDWIIGEKPLSFCEENYSYSHPTISLSGDFMIFASDKNGSQTGMNLFITRKENEKWLDPEILPPTINSKGNEFFPFLDSGNNLYFSSDGLPGFGGFDIYCSKYNGQGWDEPVNLTKRINSNMDDMAFTLDRKDGKTGFITKGDNSPKGDIKLYKLSLSEEYQKSGMDLSSLLVNLALLEGDTPMTMVIFPNIKIEEKKPKPETKNVEPKKEPVQQKEEVKPQVITEKEAKPAPSTVKTTVVVEKPTIEPEIKPQVAEAKAEIKPAPTKVIIPEPKKDEVIYRVQFASTSTSKGSYSIKVGGKDYKTWEYFYKGAYRSCVGELKTLSEAKTMQTMCRQSGYAQAFVVVFVNGERSLDSALFK